MAICVCGGGGDECGVCAAAVAGDAEAAAEAEAEVPAGDAVAVDAVADAAAVARELRDGRAGVCVVQLLLDDAGVSAGQPLWAGRGGGGDVWAGGRGGRAGGSDCRAAGGQARVAVGGGGGAWRCWRSRMCCCGRRSGRRISTALHLAALVVGVMVLDMGAQMMQVANQTRIFGLVPAARSRLNTVYMTMYFGGAAVGSALATRGVGALGLEWGVRAGAGVDWAGGGWAC